jgi:hypothetical protein
VNTQPGHLTTPLVRSTAPSKLQPKRRDRLSNAKFKNRKLSKNKPKTKIIVRKITPPTTRMPKCRERFFKYPNSFFETEVALLRLEIQSSRWKIFFRGASPFGNHNTQPSPSGPRPYQIFKTGEGEQLDNVNTRWITQFALTRIGFTSRALKGAGNSDGSEVDRCD